MKTLLLSGALLALLLARNLMAGPRDEQWRQVDEAMRAGLPQTAIERLDPIIAAATAEGAHAEAIKAIGRKIALEGNIQGNRPEEKITRLQAEIETAPPAMRPMMEAILARWYWHYYQQNRWRFMQRTQTAAAPGPDIQTWDLARIFAEIDRHFRAALADEAALKASPLSEYDELLIPGNVPAGYRPTLFDFLAYEALEFYQAGEQGGLTIAEDAFELDAAASPIFADAAEFARWSLPSDDSFSPARRAIALFQNLLQFHADDANRSAYYDADLARLKFGYNRAVGENKDDLYRAALERFIAATSGHEISSRALAELATRLHAAGESTQAHALATRGRDAFPASAGAAMCSNVIDQIEARSAQLHTERVWNAPWPTLDITYRNVTQVHFRAVLVDFREYLARQRWSFGHVDEPTRNQLLAATPAHAWSAELPPTTDFLARTEKLPAPTTLAPGFYFIVASHDPAFTTSGAPLSVASVWVSDLALVLRTRTDGGERDGFVLRAGSGEPVSGATVRWWQRDREGRFRPATPVSTDENGRFVFSNVSGEIIAMAEHGGQAVASWPQHLGGGHSRERADSQTVFFTDRALYRPGQTINYKGVSIRYDQAAGKYSAFAGLRITVVFNDPNGKEIARATHRTNDYGSFDGVFTAPRDRLMGRMSIRVLDRPSHAWFNVEEYKRPKFQVKLEAPAVAAKLDEPVHLTGKALAYTGAAIGGAEVKWRVERGVQFPAWCWWHRPPEIKAIAHGRGVTAPDGSFHVQFTAAPDRAVPAKNEPVFSYTIHADVTDTNGETRSESRVVNIGYTALRASLAAGEWQTPDQPVALSVETQSLDGDPQPARGKVTLYALQQPAAVARASLAPEYEPYYWRRNAATEPPADPSNPDTWELGSSAGEHAFSTDATGETEVAVRLPAGIYRAALETTDRFGKTVTARHTIQVIDPRAPRFQIKTPNHVAAPKWSLEPGDTFSALWGTGYESGRAFVELEYAGKPLRSFWTARDRTQQLVEQAITEEMRGGLSLRITYIRENRAYLNARTIDVPWSNKRLTVKWERFRSKLTPGEKETWTAVVTGPDAVRASAEMVAALYDASLDQYLQHDWPRGFSVFRREYSPVHSLFNNARLNFQHVAGSWPVNQRAVNWNYRSLPPELVANLWGYGYRLLARSMAPGPGAGGAADGDTVTLSQFSVISESVAGAVAAAPMAGYMDVAAGGAPAEPAGESAPDLSKIAARQNLNETAFFFPRLTADEDGVVRIRFTMPEALTEWKFLGFAHDPQLRSGYLTDRVVTAKDLMVEPNPPRFVREGDAIEFSVKISNQSDQPQSGKVRLTFADAATLKSVDQALANRDAERAFEVPAKESRSYSWRIAVPDGMGFLTYKAVGGTAKLSDGEEGFLPVLSRRILVTESLPLPIRGRATKEFELKKLVDSAGSDTLRHQSLTVQMVSQPAWYAVMALPYLMEYPYECSEQIFNRLYANALARHVANSDPKIRRIFDLWKNTPALDSPLEKNQDLKSVMLEETPWLRQAANESEARRNVGLLFDANRLDAETERTLRKLAEQQLEEGLWPWFPGGRPSEFISLYITTGFGRLRHLGATIDVAPAVKSLRALDAWMTERHREIQRHSNPDEHVPNHLEVVYLYGRSFFLQDQPIAEQHQTAVNFFRGQARKYWLRTDCRMCQAQIAIALHRFGDAATPAAIMRSIKERSVRDEELGMFWRDLELSWWWFRAPIETQAMMIEAFAEVAQDAQAVEECKVWLLKQKQTQNWRTTKATADAVYALLLRGENLLASDALVEVSLGQETIKPERVEAGAGFYEQKFTRDEITPAMGRVTVRKVDEGVSWGSVHWQYLEDMTKVTPHEATPLRLKKTLFLKQTTNRGQELQTISGPLAVGDELVVRIELRTDRDMEYLHLKDQRGSGTEPVNVLSRHRYQDGLAYYGSTRDTASHFFIEYLPKGVYVFEYSVRIQHRGAYQSGLAEIQCMYAPEFNSHSGSFTLEVR